MWLPAGERGEGQRDACTTGRRRHNKRGADKRRPFLPELGLGNARREPHGRARLERRFGRPAEGACSRVRGASIERREH